MAKLYLFLLIVLMTYTGSYGQQFEWVKTPPMSGTNNLDGLGYVVDTDLTGNVYFAGYRSDAFLYTDVFGKVGLDKYDGEGNLLWSKLIEGQAIVYDIHCDNDGNLLMAAGYVGSIVIGDFGLVTINQGVQFVALKFDSSGNLLWDYPLGTGQPFLNDFRAITTDAFNNVYLAYDDYSDSWIRKLSPAGVQLMTIDQLDVPLITSISIDDTGNIYAAGGCSNPDASFSGVAAPTSFQYSTYVVKYNQSGVYQWHRYVEDITCPDPKVVAIDADHVYFSSYLTGPRVLGDFALQGPTMGGFSDFFLSRLDGLGSYLWAREVPGAGVAHTGMRRFLDADGNGNVYFAGSTQGNIQWGEGINTVSADFGHNGVLLKYNEVGQILSALSFGGGGHDRSDCLTVSGGIIYLSSIVQGSSNFGAISVNGPATYYPVLAKLSAATLGIDKDQREAFYIFPNPASNILYGSTGEAVELKLFTITGQYVLSGMVSKDRGLPLESLSPGIYFVVHPSGVTQKLLIRK